MSEQPLRIVIIGGVAGGASAAARARRTNASAEIILVERGQNVSFANCGLPYHVGGEISRRDDLLVASPELFRSWFGIDVRLKTEAISIDRQENRVHVRVDGREDSIPYDRLILSPGAEPIRPPFVEQPLANVTTLWSLPDMDRILDELSDKPDARTVVIGGGFVGLEAAEQFARRGVACALVERAPQVLATVDEEMTLPLVDALKAGGVDVHLNAEVQAIEHDGDRATGVRIADQVLPADLIVLAIGVRPRTQLAEQAGLELGPGGGIRVDDSMRTSDPNIFAVGDCTEYQHGVLGHAALVPLAGPANRAGRIAGSNAAGSNAADSNTNGVNESNMRPVIGTSVVRVFERAAASTGLNQRQCRSAGIESRAVFIQATDHASYFPGANPLTIKLVYSPSGKILGAQCVGTTGVDKRIDVIATAIAMNGTVEDLAGLDLAYAPPFGSAKDPVHMAAFVACNDLDGRPSVLPPDADLTGLQVVDVRTDQELVQTPLPSPGDLTVHLPIDQLLQRKDELDASRPTVTVCHTGKRAHLAASILGSSGFADVSNLTGGVSIRRLFF